MHAQTTPDALRSLGTQIKLSVDRAERGTAPDSTQMVAFDQALVRLADTPEAHADATVRAKLDAVGALLSKLRLQAGQGTASTRAAATELRGGAAPAAHSAADKEIVSSGHGNRCETALGVSTNLPVELTLAAAGAARSEAWFYFAPSGGAHYRVATDSSGLDPALEVFSGCGAQARRLAANDDAIGLDAAATVSNTSTGPMFVHVTNTGGAGTLVLSVADANGSFSGTVRDAASGLPLANVTIELFNGYGGYYYGYSTQTDANGHYSGQAVDGNFYVRAAAPDPYLDTLYPSAPCNFSPYANSIQNCDLGAAQQIAVASDTSVTGVDISMTKGFRIGGTLRDTDNQPLYGSATILDAAGYSIAQVYTDPLGRFSVGPFRAATYKASAAASGFGQQLFDGIACTGSLQQNCNAAQATPILIAGQDVVGVNFQLQRLATINGTVTSGGQPLAGNFTIGLLDQYGNAVASSSYYTHDYSYGPVAPGTYYVYASATGYYSRLLGGIDCGQNCAYSIDQATTLTIDHAGQIAEADFDLTPLPQVQGHVQDSISGLPIANVRVAASPTPPASFQSVSQATTDDAGNYALSTILPGSYYLWAQSDDHVDVIYPDVECEAFNSYYYNYALCDVTGAVLLTIAPGAIPPAFDFSLLPASSIRGSAFTRIEAGADLPAQAEIDIYNGAGSVVRSVNVDLQGNYTATDLPPGGYFAAAALYSSSYVAQIWQNIDCPSGCAPTTGTPIPLAPSSDVDGIDFVLLRRDALVGRVTDTFGTPIQGVIVDMFNAASAAYAGSGVTDVNGYYAAVAPTGNAYFVATEAGFAYVDQVYSGIACPNGTAYFGLCPFTNATAVVLSYAATQPQRVDFELKSSDPIFANGFDPP